MSSRRPEILAGINPFEVDAYLQFTNSEPPATRQGQFDDGIECRTPPPADARARRMQELVAVHDETVRLRRSSTMQQRQTFDIRTGLAEGDEVTIIAHKRPELLGRQARVWGIYSDGIVSVRLLPLAPGGMLKLLPTQLRRMG